MHNVEQEGNDLLTTAQVAELTGWSITKVNRLAAHGRLPVAIKAEGKRGPRFFKRSDVQVLAERGRPS